MQQDDGNIDGKKSEEIVDLKILRSIRVLRPLKLVSGVPSKLPCILSTLAFVSLPTVNVVLTPISFFLPFTEEVFFPFNHNIYK